MRNSGFTLTELLTVLLILSVIATFTIPKVLVAQQSQMYNARVKEAIGMLAEVCHIQKLKGDLNGTTRLKDLTQFMNYVAYIDSAAVEIDNYQTAGTVDCNTGGYRCLRLHSGAMVYYHYLLNAGGTGSTNAVWFNIDPDGKVTDGSTTGPGKAVRVFIYYNGKVRTFGTIDSGTQSAFDNTPPSTYNPVSARDPSWFKW